MNLKMLRLQNFMAIGAGELRFDGRGVRLIEGKNFDSPTSTSNGSGKSSIPEGLQWAIYGTTRRGLKGDEVINRKAGKDCRVELEFDDYLIIRTRKDELLGTSLKFFQMDRRPEGLGAWLDITLGTMKDTQALIEKTINLSELTFSKVACFGQGDIKGFAGLTDAELKKVFEQALGLTFFSEDHAKVKGERVRLETSLISARADLGSAEGQKRFAEEKIAYLKKSIDEHKESTDQAVRDAESEIERIVVERDGIVTSATAEVKTAMGEIATLDAKAAKLDELETLQKKLEEKDRMLSHQLSEASTIWKLKACELDALREELEKIEAKVGTPCGECGKTYAEEDLEGAREATDARIASKLKELEDSKKRASELGPELNKIADLGKQLAERIKEYAGVRERIAALKRHIEEVKRNAKSRIADIEWRRKQTEERIKKLKSNGSSAEDDLKVAESERLSAESSILAAQKAIDDLEEAIETAKALETILASELKSYVFDSVTPELNKLVDRNIKALDDIDIEIQTVKKLKSGEFREKFSIEVNNKHGAEVFHGNSGGEQQKVNLAISLGINRLVRSMAEKPINCIFLDEAFENLDEGSSEAVTELIKSVDAPNIFLITHRGEIKDLIPDAIKVEKRGGIATLH